MRRCVCCVTSGLVSGGLLKRGGGWEGEEGGG